ncbi:MAG: type II toxin-antitoxin system VapC family toxin [Armatimonadetes bacterium]|nr:type II toxin-antitoxin system VapC family toxin [Armatimonadota bacterium]
MAEEYLLDTNIVSAFIDKEASVVAQVQANSVFLSSIVLGELYFGAYKSGRVTLNVARVEVVEHSILLIECDGKTAKIFGEVKNQLRRIGRPIPENDIWIAATALQHDLILASRDAHFQAVDGLKVEIW